MRGPAMNDAYIHAAQLFLRSCDERTDLFGLGEIGSNMHGLDTVSLRKLALKTLNLRRLAEAVQHKVAPLRGERLRHG